MERVLGNSEKLIYDSGPNSSGVVPYLPLNDLTTVRRQPATSGQPQAQSGSTR
jgi:membrane protease subunit HflK